MPSALAPSAAPPVLDGIAAWKCYPWFLFDAVGLLAAMHERYGRMVVIRERIPFRKSFRQMVIVSGADLNRQVLTDADTYQTGGVVIRGPRDSALNRLRRGVVTVNGQKHHDQRKLVGSLFMPKEVREFYPRMVDLIGSELDGWPVGTACNLAPRISRIALVLAANNLLAGEEVGEAMQVAELTADVLRRSSTMGVWMFPVNLAGTPYRRLLERAAELERRVLTMMDRHRLATEDSPLLLDRLVSAHRAEPDRAPREDLAGQFVVLFAASHETITKAVIWTLFLLSQHPRILNELQEELRDRCGEAPPLEDDLAALPLLDAITKESLRLFPPAPFVARRVRREAALGTLPVRPGDSVVLSHYATHRDPEVFPLPDQFRPQRWFGSTPDSFAYLPFSAGPRTCIAKLLGSTTINLIVAMIVQRYRLRMVPHSRMDRSHLLTLAPQAGLPMVIEPPGVRWDAPPLKGNVLKMVDLTRSDATGRPAGFDARSRASFVRAA